MQGVEIGRRLSEEIEKRGITIVELAQRAGVGRAAVYRILAGHISGSKVETFTNILEAIGMTLQDFFAGKVPPAYRDPATYELHERLQAIVDEGGAELSSTAAGTINALYDSLLRQKGGRRKTGKPAKRH